MLPATKPVFPVPATRLSYQRAVEGHTPVRGQLYKARRAIDCSSIPCVRHMCSQAEQEEEEAIPC